jgi:hypothetical protein
MDQIVLSPDQLEMASKVEVGANEQEDKGRDPPNSLDIVVMRFKLR